MNIHQNYNDMKKNLFLQLSVLAVLIVFVSSCSQKAAEYTNAIPANASGVVSINLKTLAEKAGVNDKENKEALIKLTEAMKSGMNAATFQQLEAVMKDPSKSGVDVTAPVYIFKAPTFDYTTLVAKVIDEDELKNFLEVTQKELSNAPITEGDGYSLIQITKQSLVAFNASTLLAVDYNNAAQLDKIKEGITSLLKQTEENSINQSEAFKKMQKQSGEVNMFFSPSGVLGAYTKQINFGMPKDIDLKDLIILGSLSFEKGKIEMVIKNHTENPELKAMLARQIKSTRPIENTFLKYFPKSTVGLLSIGVNGEEFYNLLQENEQFRNEFSITKADEIKNLFSTFQNDLTIGLINITMSKAPSFLAYASIQNNVSLKDLYEKKDQLGLSRGDDIVKLTDNDYVYKSRSLNIFFGIRDKQMYATNDEILYKNICKDVDPSAKDTNYASGIKGKRSAIVINAEAILELPIVKMLVGYGGAEYNMYYSLGSNISYLEATSESDEAHITLQLKDKNVNALKQVANFVKEFAGM